MGQQLACLPRSGGPTADRFLPPNQKLFTMPLFVLSPASLVHSAIFAGFYSYLSVKTAIVRQVSGKDRTALSEKDDAVYRASRVHGNFAEYTPFTITLLFLAELNGAPTAWVHAAYSTLFVARVAHSFALTRPHTKYSKLIRAFGFFGTLAVILGAGLYNLGLGYEPLKSFLGIQ